MEFSHFHFAETRWFWGLILIPIVCFLYIRFYRANPQIERLESFIDKHLIPHLLKSSRTGQISVVKSIILGSLLWIFLLAAMASPRWDFKEIQNFKQDKTLLILLDLSKSMDSDDIKPSRLFRARQEIEDLINLNTDIKVGLLGFAADAHIISPITDDMNNIKHLLPLIGTDLVYVQGTRLSSTLKTARQMLAYELGSNKSILIITDGGFQDQEASSIVSDLAGEGVVIHTLGIGTEIGVMFVDHNGYVKRNGEILTSKLEKTKLQELSKVGGGQYFDTDYSDKNTLEILNQINLRNSLMEKDLPFHDNKQWEERFYIFIFPVMLIILLWFRRGFTFPVILLFVLAAAQGVQAAELGIGDRFFLNKDQQAQKALEEIEDFDTAIKLFDDPYKRGVAHYKAGDFAEAEKYFRQNQRPEMQENALYNLGNSLTKQNKLDEAISTYQQVLEQDPNHEKAKHNMEIAKLMMVQKKDKKKEEEKKIRPQKNEDDRSLGGGGGGVDDDEEEDEENKKDNGDGGEKDNKSDKNKSDKESDGQNDKDKTLPDKGDNSDDKSSADDSGNKDQKQKPEQNDQKTQNGADGTASGQEIDIDQWLNKISNDHKNFLKNQFYIESQIQNNNTNPNLDPW